MKELAELLWRDFTGLLYPDVCLACKKSLVKGEQYICLFCRHKLPKTNFPDNADNPMEKLFWGRLQVEAAAAFCYFHRGNRVQKLIHQLKYRGKRALGVHLGELFAEELNQSVRDWKDADIILPVPLHPSRKKIRGFNQCDPLAEGLSSGLGVPYDVNLLVRKLKNVSQTGKTKAERWNNVRSIFGLRDASRLEGKTVILLDDVITTGSTTEACAAEILKAKGAKVRILTLAFAPRMR